LAPCSAEEQDTEPIAIGEDAQRMQTDGAPEVKVPTTTVEVAIERRCLRGANVNRRAALPPLDERVKSIKLQNAIEQQFAGTGGVYRQINLEKRTVTISPSGGHLCESTAHQTPTIMLSPDRIGNQEIKKWPIVLRGPELTGNIIRR
jgi:hypothetical protein